MKNILEEAEDLNDRYITTDEDDIELVDDDPWDDVLPFDDEELEDELEDEEEDEEALEELNFED